jgi:hypothetical protein
MGAPPRFFRFMHLRIPIVEDKEESLALPARISFCRRHGDFSPDAAVSRIGPKSKWVSNRRLNCLMTCCSFMDCSRIPLFVLLSLLKACCYLQDSNSKFAQSPTFGLELPHTVLDGCSVHGGGLEEVRLKERLLDQSPRICLKPFHIDIWIWGFETGNPSLIYRTT